MDFNLVLNLIGTVGFPITVCLLLMWYIVNSNKRHTEEVTELSENYKAEVTTMLETHKQECKDLSTALNNNTVVMKQILEHMRKE